VLTVVAPATVVVLFVGLPSERYSYDIVAVKLLEGDVALVKANDVTLLGETY
jgi:hypothetical protein